MTFTTLITKKCRGQKIFTDFSNNFCQMPVLLYNCDIVLIWINTSMCLSFKLVAPRTETATSPSNQKLRISDSDLATSQLLAAIDRITGLCWQQLSSLSAAVYLAVDDVTSFLLSDWLLATGQPSRC